MATVEYTRNRDYKDISMSFARNPVTNDVVAVTGEDAVKRSIKNLLHTIAGEVPFFPEFGTRLHRMLFEPIDPITTLRIATEIRTTIEGFEPRCEIQSLDVRPAEDELKYEITMTFRLINLAEPVTLTLFLTRLR